MLGSFLIIVRREVLLAVRHPMDVVMPLLFFLLVVSLFPLGLGGQGSQLRDLAPAVLWVAALLATLLSLPRLFAQDHADGTLDQWVFNGDALPMMVLGKLAAHWLLCGLPLALLAPLYAVQFRLGTASACTLAAGLLLGTPVLSCLGAVGAALTLGARGGGVLLALLVLPLYVPVLIFGAGAARDGAAAASGPALLLLGAMFVAAAGLAPWATGAALRIALE